MLFSPKEKGMDVIQTDNRIIRLPVEYSPNSRYKPPLSNEIITDVIEKGIHIEQIMVGPLETIMNDAARRFLPDHPQGIGFRAIMASNDGPTRIVFDYGQDEKFELNVKDIPTILRDGSELDDLSEITVSRQEGRELLRATSHMKVWDYLTQGVLDILHAEDKSAMENVTPAILIYDLSNLVPTRDEYRHKFLDISKASESLLAIYPINIDELKSAA